MKTTITFSQAVDGFLLAARSRHLSQNTINDYFNTYRKFLAFLAQDPPFAEITSRHIESFLAAQDVSKKTLLNYHVGLSSMWTWGLKESLVVEHIVRKVSRPKPEKRAIQPYSEIDIRTMLSSLNRSRTYFRPGKKECDHRLLHADRNRAIILLLLDTGMRATELCSLHIHHVDLKERTVRVFGKGDKERIVPFSARTGQSIWRYLAPRKDDDIGDFLFVNKFGYPLDGDRLLKSLQVIGRRAGVRGVTVHRFRHTFAINYLRNGGDPWSLQMMLGHSTLEMVKTYLSLANADLQKNHRKASPVDNWRL